MPSRKISVDTERLRTARRQVSLTQQEVAYKVGVDRQSIYGYEAGKQSPSPASLNMIAQVYGVTVDWLTGKSDETPQRPPAAAPTGFRIEQEVAPAPSVQGPRSLSLRRVLNWFRGKGDGEPEPELPEISREEAIENFKLILDQPNLSLMARQGVLTDYDMKDIADFIRFVRAEEEKETT